MHATIGGNVPRFRQWIGMIARVEDDSLNPIEASIGEPTTPRVQWSAISAIGGAVLLADQVVKWVMTAWIGPDASVHRVELLGRVAAFEYVENRGAAFGIFAGQPLLLAVGAIVATGLFIGLMRTTLRQHPLVPFAVGLVLGGAIGNLIDRIRLGYVVDFVAIGTFPRFNVADSAITIGLLLLAWMAFREESTPKPNALQSDLSQSETQATTSMRDGSHA